MSLDYYWELNPKQFVKHLKAFERKEIEKVKYHDRVSHSLGQYIRIAFNDPNEYPKHAYHSDEAKELKEGLIMSDGEMEKVARRNTIIMGGEIK